MPHLAWPASGALVCVCVPAGLDRVASDVSGQRLTPPGCAASVRHDVRPGLGVGGERGFGGLLCEYRWRGRCAGGLSGRPVPPPVPSLSPLTYGPTAFGKKIAFVVHVAPRVRLRIALVPGSY